MFGCERCGARFNSARAAAIRDCPRCLLRDDVTSPLSWTPDRPRPQVASDRPERYGKRTTGERNAGHSVPP